MAHELQMIDGQATAFYTKRSAWHNLGHVLTEAPSFDEAVRLGALDYHVEKRPTTYTVPLPGGDSYQKASTKAFVTVRTDTERELGAVGPEYQPVQNLDAFRLFEPLLDKGVLALEAGGVLRDGADAWLLGKWDFEQFGPITREVFGASVEPYALLSTNHTGRRGVLVQKTNYRVECANMLGFAESAHEERIIVRHAGDAHERLVEAAEALFLNCVEEYETLSLQYKAMKACFLTDAQFKALVLDPVATNPQTHKRWNPEARMANAVVERYEAKVAEVTRLWTAGAGHVGDRSAWEAYNGAVEAIDHNETLWPTRGGVYRTQSLMDGTLGQMKKRVLHGLVAVATGAGPAA